MADQENDGLGAVPRELEDVPEETFDDPKWHGVPPTGRSPLPGKWFFVLQITGVLLVEFVLWAIYRNLTADIYGKFGTFWFYIGHIFAAPLIHLGPILVYWVLIRKERFYRFEDPEDGRHMSFSLGPFKMTRKFLLSAVLVGLIGGIVWRVTEMIVSDTTSILLGGSRLGTLTLFNLYAQSDFGIFLLMTFVMFFIVGPVEEFEFRSFVHDQSQRVLPKYQALIFSSVFFGLSHIPIAVFIYKLSFIDLIFAEISWMTAGAVFGALYMWSRNIFACIVMHGIGNWQLSVFLWQSQTLGAGLEHTEYLIVSLVTSIVANAALMIVFYLIHKFYWEPQRRGEAAFGGKLFKVQSFVFDHDNGQRNVVVTTVIMVIVTVMLLSSMVVGAVFVGNKDLSSLDPEIKVKDKGTLDLSLYETISEVTNEDVPFLEEGAVFERTVQSSETKIVKSVKMTVEWADETEPPGRPRLRPYTNQPDTFSLTLTDGERTVTDQAANPQNAEGRISLELSINESDMIELMGNYTIKGTVKMEDAGIWTTIGLLGLTDRGNTFSIQIEVEYLMPKQVEGGSPTPELFEIG